MTAHEVELQLKQVVSIDTYVRQLAEPGVDAVNRTTFGDDVMDHLARARVSNARARWPTTSSPKVVRFTASTPGSASCRAYVSIDTTCFSCNSTSCAVIRVV